MARTIRIRDTLSGGLRELEPRDDARVAIYACGPTVYGPLHVGNARPYVVFSLLKRFLVHEGYEATFVSNVTDVNDKIYAAARQAGKPSEELAQEMTRRYEEDTARLGLGRPDSEPRASETIGEIVDLIQALIDRGQKDVLRSTIPFPVASETFWAYVGSTYVRPSVAFKTAKRTPAPATFVQSMGPCQCETSMPEGAASSRTTSSGSRTRRHTRCRKRAQPWRPESVHSTSS